MITDLKKAVTVNVGIDFSNPTNPPKSPIMKAIGYLADKISCNDGHYFLDDLGHPFLMVSGLPSSWLLDQDTFGIMVHYLDHDDYDIGRHFDYWLQNKGFLDKDKNLLLKYCYQIIAIKFSRDRKRRKIIVSFHTVPEFVSELEIHNVNIDEENNEINVMDIAADRSPGRNNETHISKGVAGDFGESLKEYFSDVSPAVGEIIDMFVELMNRNDI